LHTSPRKRRSSKPEAVLGGIFGTLLLLVAVAVAVWSYRRNRLCFSFRRLGRKKLACVTAEGKDNVTQARDSETGDLQTKDSDRQADLLQPRESYNDPPISVADMTAKI